MKFYVQWALAQPGDWEEFELSTAKSDTWRKLPKRPVPIGTEIIDNTKGWTFDVCIDGVRLYGFDHLALEPTARGIKAYCWNDDPQDETYKWGEVWEFLPHRNDLRFGGQLNTHQVKTVYSENMAALAHLFPQETSGGPVLLRPWSEFPKPPENITRHGIWIRDTKLFENHTAVRRPLNWRDW